jgi:hypothetical protein
MKAKDDYMMRTRHIEITTYSRRVTVTRRGESAAEPVSALPSVEIVTDAQEVIASALAELNEGQLIAGEATPVQMVRARPLHGLRNWLRNRF